MLYIPTKLYLEGLNQRPEKVKNSQTACAHVPHRCRQGSQAREAVRHEDEFNEEVDEDDQAIVSGGERAGREAGGAGGANVEFGDVR